MMLQKIALVLLGIALNIRCYSQDATKYCQKNTVMYSNCIELIHGAQKPRKGTFSHRLSHCTGISYGWGTYRKFLFFIKLNYSTELPPFQMETIEGTSDSLTILWYEKGARQDMYSIMVSDSSNQTKEFQSDYFDASLTIPKAEIHDSSFTLKYVFGWDIAHFDLSTLNYDTVIIHAVYTGEAMKIKEALFLVTPKGIRGKAAWRKRRRTLFGKKD